MKEVRAALIGYGAIAKLHKAGYDRLRAENAPVRLVAICDSALREAPAGLENIRFYQDADELLEKEEFEMADICVPSFLHRTLAEKLLLSGKNVLSEKPMALNSEDAEALLRTAEQSGKRLMIAQCLRFDPAYIYLKTLIDEKRYGRLRSLTMERLSWRHSRTDGHWYSSTEKSGGALFDLHIHDIDMAQHLLGTPQAVSTLGLNDVVKLQYVDSRLLYDDVIVSAIASFDQVGKFPFTMTYRANFDGASVVFNGETVRIYPIDAEPFDAILGDGERMTDEIRYFAALVLDKSMENRVNPPESSLQTIRLLERMRESAEAGGTILKFEPTT